MDTPFTYIDVDCFVGTDGKVSDTALKTRLNELAPDIAEGAKLIAVLPMGRRGSYQRYLVIVQNAPGQVSLNPAPSSNPLVVQDFDPTDYTPELPS